MIAVHNKLQYWACKEQWHEPTKYRQAKQLLGKTNLSLTKYALWLI